MYSNVDVLPNKFDEFKLLVENLMILIIEFNNWLTGIKHKNKICNLNQSEIKIYDFNLLSTDVDEHNGRSLSLYIHNSLEAYKIETKTNFEESFIDQNKYIIKNL